MTGVATAGLRAPLAAALSLLLNQARSLSVLACLPFAQFGTLSLCMVRCHTMSQSLKSHKHAIAGCARPRQASIYERMSSNAVNTQTACYSQHQLVWSWESVSGSQYWF